MGAECIQGRRPLDGLGRCRRRRRQCVTAHNHHRAPLVALPHNQAGGGSQLKGLCERIADEVNVRVWLAEDSMTCVARGAGRILEDYDNLRSLLAGLERGSTQH